MTYPNYTSSFAPSPIIQFAPNEIIDLDHVRRMTYDEPNDRIVIVFAEGDIETVPLSQGGQEIWDAYNALATPVYTEGA